MSYNLWKWKVTVWATSYGNRIRVFGQTFRQPLEQPLMEMVCLVVSARCLVVSTDCLVVSARCLVVSTDCLVVSIP